MANGGIASFADFVALLQEDKVRHSLDESAQIVQIPTRSGPLEGTLFVRWEKHLPYVQVIHPMITDVPADRVATVESALAYINHAIALPGFAYDHDRRFIYNRVCLAVEPSGIDAAFMRTMIMACVNNARDFLLALRGVLAGDPPSGAVKAAVDQANRERAAEAAAAFVD